MTLCLQGGVARISGSLGLLPLLLFALHQILTHLRGEPIAARRLVGPGALAQMRLACRSILHGPFGSGC